MRKKILLVEDTKTIQQLYQAKLLTENFMVITADNGMEAIQQVSKDKPDLMLLDLMMPIMDGFKVMQVIKTNPRLKDIPIIVFSSKGQPEEITKALELGADDYIVKTLTKPNDVIDKIRKVLAKADASEGKEVANFRIGVKADLFDAPKLSSEYRLNNFKCKKCGGDLILNLISDFSHDEPWFSGKFICAQCR